MSWEPFVLNGRADADAAQAVTLVLFSGAPGASGTDNVVTTAALAWSPGGAEGPVPALQPATVGVAYAAPLVSVPASSVTYYGFRDASGTWLGGFPVSPAVESVTLASRLFLVKIGPNV